MNPLNLSAGLVFVATGLLVPFSPIPLALPWGLLYVAPISIAGLSIAVSKKSQRWGRVTGILAVIVLFAVVAFAAWAASSSQIGSLWGVRSA
jgi:hypothetical protein